ncbi:MAG: tetratricopeptide repeat protein [Phycisphaerae bacterium]
MGAAAANADSRGDDGPLPPTPGNFADLTFQITTSKGPLLPLEPMTLTIRLANRTPQAILGHTVSAPYGNLSKIYVASKGKPFEEFPSMDSAWEPLVMSQSRRVLEPGFEEVVRGFLCFAAKPDDKTGRYLLPSPGDYRVKATLANLDRTVTIESNVLDVRVAVPQGEDAEEGFEFMLVVRDRIAPLFDEVAETFMPGSRIPLQAVLCANHRNVFVAKSGTALADTLAFKFSLEGQPLSETAARDWKIIQRDVLVVVGRGGCAIEISFDLVVPDTAKTGKYLVEVDLDPARKVLGQQADDGPLYGRYSFAVLASKTAKVSANQAFEDAIRDYFKGDYRAAIRKLDQVLTLPDVRDQQKCEIYAGLGNAYAKIGDVDKAKEMYLKSIEAWKKTGDKINSPDAVFAALERLEAAEKK